MNQEDFRKLLTTPKAPRREDGAFKAGIGGAKILNEGGSKKESFKKPFQKKNYKSKYKQTEDDPDAHKYRDRARERRGNANPDYAGSEEMLSQLNKNDGESGKSGEDVLDKSKFLGGDVEHTHLVKGLDFRLLKKVRGEIGEEDGGRYLGKDEEEAKRYVEQLHGGDGPVTYLNPVTKLLHDMALDRNQNMATSMSSKVKQSFQPGRVTYVWDLGLHPETGKMDGSPDIPVSVIANKALMNINGGIKDGEGANDLVIDKVIGVWKSLRENEAEAGDKKSKERKEVERRAKMEELKMKLVMKKVEGESPGTIEEEDTDDIFADAGRDYVLEPIEKKIVADAAPISHPATHSFIKPSYFAELNSEEDEAKQHQPLDISTDPSISAIITTNPLLSKTLGGVEPSSLCVPPEEAKEEPIMAKLPKRDIRDELAELQDDSDDDDGEGDLAQMDMGTSWNKKRQMSRWDFDSEEKYAEYKESQVHMPRAAFQFGVKAADGRKRGKFDEGKRISKQRKKGGGDLDGKLNKDYQQLNQVMMGKYGKGLGDGDKESGVRERGGRGRGGDRGRGRGKREREREDGDGGKKGKRR